MKFMKIFGKRKRMNGYRILKCVNVLSNAFSYARYAKGMVTGFGMKNSLTLPSLANKTF